MNLNKEELAKALADIQEEEGKQTEFLVSKGWTEKDDVWSHPGRKKTFRYLDEAYNAAITDVLTENGWRQITELGRNGNRKNNFGGTVQAMARYQSPKTGNIYVWFDAVYFAENGFDESSYPEGCAGRSKLMSEFAGPNFKGDYLKTLFTKKNEEEYHLVAWTMTEDYINAGLALLKNPPLEHDGNKHWSNVAYDQNHPKFKELFEVGWHEVNGFWGYYDD